MGARVSARALVRISELLTNPLTYFRPYSLNSTPANMYIYSKNDPNLRIDEDKMQQVTRKYI